MISDIAILGLFVGFLLFFWFHAGVGWTSSFRSWWQGKVESGKPFGCTFCMSFWASLSTSFVWGLANDFSVAEFIIIIPCVSIIGLIISELAERLGTIYL